ncbi:DUF2130 domain-containing protein [Lamprobacter modestohalophilus]|uniref:DUF2130 domain-containing protein n=1 Tax=Lamprobacter modestohalophilus TaxID=1064514 RepID=UPI002ADEC6F9|nr:DUF2130 domain-containing protein [Lamprobacter modestohalophilus]MEA1052491.1 DUF2130 domain-containing protein [Lamprobacter modestohalophilus]
MNGTTIHCPNCDHEFALSEVLKRQIRDDLQRRLKTEHEQRLQRVIAETEQRARSALGLELKDLQNQLSEHTRKAEDAQARELKLREEKRALEEASKRQAEQIRTELEASLREEQTAQLAKDKAAMEAKLREQSALELAQLQADLNAQREKVRVAEAAELALRQEKSKLEERAQQLDLEIARKVDAEKQKLEFHLRETFAKAQDLKFKEKEKQISDLREALDDAKRRSELGSQELQGEVLELDIQAELERQFPADQIAPVPKGMRGADIIHQVSNDRFQVCGTIVWESKNTKGWQVAWIDKLKQDQRHVGASQAVIVSVALPPEIQGFGRIDGVWVCGLKFWPALAVALREQLIQVSQAQAALAGKGAKMELLYEYLSGNEFRQRVEAIVEGFEAMQLQVQRERRAMEKQWSEREKQLQRVLSSTAGMYGSLQGIVGSAIAAIPTLEVDSSGP